MLNTASCFDAMSGLINEDERIDRPEIIFTPDSDPDEDQICGTVTLVEPEKEDLISSYTIYWGNSSGEKTGLICELAKDEVSAGRFLPENTAVPPGATHFIAYAVSSEDGSSSAPAMLDIDDIVITEAPSAGFLTAGKAPSGGIAERYMAVYDGRLFLNGDDGGGNGVELWSYDGTNPPVPEADVWAGSGNSYPAFLCKFNGKLYFRANGGNLKGTELWAFDSATSSANLEYDIYSATAYGSTPMYMILSGSSMFFSADRSDTGREIWTYSGTSAPLPVSDINPGSADSDPAYLCVFRDSLYFQADTGTCQIWNFNGTDSVQVSSLPAGYDPSHLCVFNDELIFSAGKTGEEKGRELWSWDGTGSFTEKYDLIEGEDSSSPEHLRVFRDKLFFQAVSPGCGEELWCFNGRARPAPVSDILPGSSGSRPECFTEFEGRLYFTALNASSKRVLWVLYIK